MSNMMRKLSLFFLAALLLQFTSCGMIVINHNKTNGDSKVEDTTDVTTYSEETVATTDEPLGVIKNDYSEKIASNLAQVPGKNYNSTVFKITSPDISSLNEDGSLDFLSEAAAVRNKLVSDKHSVSIVSSKVDFDVYYEEVNTAVKSGMYYSDLLLLPQESVASFATGNLIMNMRSLPGLDFEAPFFNSSSVGAAAGGFNSYAIAGPASIYPYSLPAVYYNVELCTSNSVDLYACVESGNWTWDKFFETALLAQTNDYTFSWGTTNLGDAVYESAFVSSGHMMINSGIMKMPELAFDFENSASAVDALKKLMMEPKALRTNEESMTLFTEGKVLFQFEKLSAMTELRGASVKWGILPLPKLSADAEYKTLAGEDSLMFACPATVTTPEKTAIILMSLNAASDGPIKDAYIGYYQYNILRDNGSANMLDYIIDSTVYDFSYTFGTMYGAIGDGTYNVVRKAAFPDETMERLLGIYKGSLDRTLSYGFGLNN